MNLKGQLRLARASDAPWLKACAEAAYQPYVVPIGRRPAPMDADFPSHIARAEAWLFVGSKASNVADPLGFAILQVQGDVLHIDNVALLPAFQGRGLGKDLLGACEDWGRHQGCRIARLYTNAKMLENQRFYPALGYREVDRRRQDGFDRIFYEKPLA